MTDQLPPCPFCKSEPVFPDAKDVFGTFYDAGCEDCGIPTLSIQIIDCFDYPRDHVHDSWNGETYQYGIEYIEMARQEAIKAWSTRYIPEGMALVPIKNITKVERSSDQSVTIVTTSCRAASEIENVIKAAGEEE